MLVRRRALSTAVQLKVSLKQGRPCSLYYSTLTTRVSHKASSIKQQKQDVPAMLPGLVLIHLSTPLSRYKARQNELQDVLILVVSELNH